MSGRAPGQDGPKDEPECFNCGVKGHFVMACPEEVRKVPAGLQAFRQRKAASQSKNSSQGGSGQGKSAGGMVITRYGPPPGHLSQLANYPPPANLPLPPPPPAPAPAPAPYYPPPPAHAPAQPPPAAAWPYPPNSYGPGYPAPPPPAPSAHPYPPYDHPYGQPSGYDPPPPGPPTAAPYYPPYGAPQQPYCPPTHPPTQQAYPPPAPYTPQTPAPAATGHPAHPAHPSLPPVPPPSVYAPPPIPTYTAGPYEAHQPYYPPAYPSEHSRGQLQHDRNRNQRHRNGPHHKGRDRDRDRDKGRDRDRDRGAKHQRKGQAQRNRSLSRTAESATTRPSTLPTALPASLPARQPRRTPDAGKPAVEPAADKEEVAKPKDEASPESEGDDFEWELQAAFAEHPTKPADAVGQPLPNEYTDAPTIPPAFDSTSIKSDFFSADNCSGFLRSIRESKFWDKAKNDPAFLAWPGMVRCRFQNHPYDYPSYPSGNPTGGRTETIVKDELVLDEIVVKQRYSPRQERELSASRSSDMMLHGSLGKHARAGTGSDRHYQAKRFKGSEASTPRSTYNSPSSGPRRYRGDAGEGGSSEQAPQRSSYQSDSRAHSNSQLDPGQSNESSSNPGGRYDSGYRRNKSPERMNGRSRSRSRLDTRYRSRSRSPPRGYARHGPRRVSESPRDRHGRERSPRSPPASPPRSGSSSPLDDLEMEILGMVREVVPEKKRPRADAVPKRRPVKVADAFSRRW